MSARNNRSCRTCGTRLRVDNDDVQCSPCRRNDTVGKSRPEPKNEEFWQRPTMAEALKSRDFGKVMYAYRYEHRPVITQAALGRWLNMTQAQISRLERGAKPPSDLDKLTAWASVLHISESSLWFKLPARETSAPATTSRVDFGWFCGRRRAPALNTGMRVPLDVESIRETTATF
ncbi:helix-turn-helix domain-containing protein [Saccharopolyspora sp. NPDC000995]